jgi:ATP-dependent Lon protease
MYIRGLTFHYVTTILDVLDFALLKEQVEHPIQFKFEEESPSASPSRQGGE